MAFWVRHGGIMRWVANGTGIASVMWAVIFFCYKVDDSGRTGVVVFVRAGTHADLFE